MKIIIPTYNRHEKLKRTIDYYNSFSGFEHTIIVLDGSDDEIIFKNTEFLKDISLNIIHNKMPNSTYMDRVNGYIAKIHPDEIICMANDEDCFTPNYLDAAQAFLNENLTYSGFVGRCFTLDRKILFRRLSHHRSVITQYDLNSESPAARIHTLSSILLVGCSILFYGVRRAKTYQSSFDLQKKVEVATTRELIDQIVLAQSGKIQFCNELMLLRDETRDGYIWYEGRQDKKFYFDTDANKVAAKFIATEYPESENAIDNFFEIRSSENSFGNGSIALQSTNSIYRKYKNYDFLKHSFRSKLFQIYWRIAYYISEFFYYRFAIFELEKIIGRKPMKIWLKHVKSS